LTAGTLNGLKTTTNDRVFSELTQWARKLLRLVRNSVGNRWGARRVAPLFFAANRGHDPDLVVSVAAARRAAI